MQNIIAIVIGVTAATIVGVAMHKFVLPMALVELKRKAEMEGRRVFPDEEKRVQFNFRYIVPIGLIASFTISALYLIGDMR